MKNDPRSCERNLCNCEIMCSLWWLTLIYAYLNAKKLISFKAFSKTINNGWCSCLKAMRTNICTHMCTDWTFIVVVIVVASVFLLFLLLLLLFFIFYFFYQFFIRTSTLFWLTLEQWLRLISNFIRSYSMRLLWFSNHLPLCFFQGVIKVINRDESFLYGFRSIVEKLLACEQAPKCCGAQKKAGKRRVPYKKKKKRAKRVESGLWRKRRRRRLCFGCRPTTISNAGIMTWLVIGPHFTENIHVRTKVLNYVILVAVSWLILKL